MKAASVNHWMPLHIGDYLRDTMHLDTQQHGAYLLLLASYWTRQGPLPDDDNTLAAIAKLSRKEWEQMKPVIQAFFRIEGKFWHQKRADAEIARASGVFHKRKEGGHRSQAVQRAKREHSSQHSSQHSSPAPEALLPAVAEDSCRPLQPQPQPQPQGGSPLTPLGGHADDSVQIDRIRQTEAIWSLYPKKRGQGDGMAAIMAAIARDGFQVVEAGTRAVVESYQRRGPEATPGQYLPLAEKFFASSSYKDDPAQYAPRPVTMNVGDLRRLVDDLKRQKDEHPGNPNNADGSFDRKDAAKAEFKALKELLAAKSAELNRLMGGGGE